MDLRIVADGTRYKFPDKLTLGELNTLAKDFGVTDPSTLDVGNILHVSGMLYIAMRRDNPTIAPTMIHRMLDAVTTLDFEDMDPAPEEPATADPTLAANAATVAPAQA